MPGRGAAVRGTRRRTRRRTAVVAGTAGYAVAKHAGNNNDDQTDQVQADQPVADDNTDTNDYSAELEQLAKLHDDGVLTDEEFEAKKKQILGL